MEELKLVRPSVEHKRQYEEMMEEWEGFGGRMNPGALRRYSHKQQRNVTYEEWLQWIEDDRQAGQDLYFFMKGSAILGAISIRLRCAEVDGHSGYGIRPSQRRKGYAAMMLSMALPVMKERGIDPVIITCAKDNIGSAKTILRNGGVYIKDAADGEGETVEIYHIHMENSVSDCGDGIGRGDG